jgi:hypothetical protein
LTAGASAVRVVRLAQGRREGGVVGSTLLVLAFVAAAVIGADAEDRPMPQLVSSSPAVKARVAGPTTVSVVLDLTRGDVTDPSSIRMLVDGADITSHCRVVGTRDVPPSRVEVTCPLGALDAGLHAAEVRLGPPGLGYSYRWDFTVIAA